MYTLVIKTFPIYGINHDPISHEMQRAQVMVHQRDRTADIVAHVNLGKLSMIDLAGTGNGFTRDPACGDDA